MEIRSNAIRLLSSAPELSDRTRRWQPGQIVKVVAVSGTNLQGTLEIQIGGLRLRAVSAYRPRPVNRLDRRIVVRGGLGALSSPNPATQNIGTRLWAPAGIPARSAGSYRQAYRTHQTAY